MIQGRVVRLRALVSVSFRLADGRTIDIEFVIDTGFEGALALPPAAVAALGLPYITDIDANLANDVAYTTPVHSALIIWKGQEVPVAVLAMGSYPLLGTALLAETELLVQFTDGGIITIDDIT